jgi:sulfide dehydrogenase subunit beta
MFRIVRREQFSPVTFLWEVLAPDIARVALPGHFVIVRHGPYGERVPLTIADFDRERGTITMVIQAVGKSTRAFMELREGDSVDDVAGPLGKTREFGSPRTVICVAGGLGVAPVFPQLRRYKEGGARTIAIIGFRSAELMFWVDRFRQQADELLIATDDGSFGIKGLVTVPLKQVLDRNDEVDEVLAIGPPVMMKACAQLTRERGVPTVVSLNPIMVDGSGMCGGCRVTVGGKMQFACVDGPEFDGHAVDFDEMMLRSRRFDRQEKESLRRFTERHTCKVELAAGPR